jgi:hypothetical protein
MFSRVGIMPTDMKYVLNNANPTSNPQAFEQTAQLYQYTSAKDRTYLEQNLDAGKSLQYDVYWNARNYQQMTNVQAMQLSATVGTKEYQARLKEITGRPEYDDLKSAVDSQLSSKWNLGSPNTAAVESVGYARKIMQDLALQHYATGNVSFAASAAWAKERFQATHTVVNGRPLWTGGMPSSAIKDKHFPDAADWAVAEYATSKSAAGKPVPKKGYYLATDDRTRIDGKLMMFRGDDNTPEGWRLDPTTLMHSYASRDVHAKQAEKQKDNLQLPEESEQFDN